ncbi:MAG: pseudouridine synthase [Gammaproteobacteria bacterium]
MLPILYRDDEFVAIDKPAGLLVHRSPISRDEVFALQTLRDQIGQRVYPVHRLDRATSGVLLFALNKDSAAKVSAQFEARTVVKRYLAVARGWIGSEGAIDHPLINDEGSAQAAQTRYTRLAKTELPFAVDRYPTTRYSLVQIEPLTGRRHQIRRHFKHISHHLIGDTTHGNGKHNRFFRERFGVRRLLLMGQELRFLHPRLETLIRIEAAPDGEFAAALNVFAEPGTR